MCKRMLLDDLLVGSREPLVPCGDHEKEHLGKFQQPEAVCRSCVRQQRILRLGVGC